MPNSADTLRLETRAPERVRRGDPVPVTLVIQNTSSSDTLELHFSGREIAFDILVEDEQGRVIWRRLSRKTTLAILRVELLAPGKSLTFSDRWLQRDSNGALVDPGLYHIHGEFPSDSPQPLRTPPVVVRVE